MLKRFVVSSSPCMLPSQSAAIPVGLPGHSVSLVVIPTLFINYLLVDECCCCCWSCTDQTLSGACDRCTVPRAEISLTQSRPTWWQMFRGFSHQYSDKASSRYSAALYHFTRECAFYGHRQRRSAGDRWWCWYEIIGRSKQKWDVRSECVSRWNLHMQTEGFGCCCCCWGVFIPDFELLEIFESTSSTRIAISPYS